MKVKIFIIAFFVVGLVCLPLVVQAFDWGDVDLDPTQTSTNWQPFGFGTTLPGVIGTIITLAFDVSAIVAVIYLIIGGFSYVTSSGDPEAVQVAKATIVNAIIGLVVILASYLIVQFVLRQIKATPTLNNVQTVPGGGGSNPAPTPDGGDTGGDTGGGGSSPGELPEDDPSYNPHESPDPIPDDTDTY